MNEAEVIEYITGTFDNVETVTANGDTFFFLGSERMFPFATLVTSNYNDQASDLDRPGVYRLNIGVSKETFRALFGTSKSETDTSDGAESAYDFTQLDQLMPHPVYGRMHWVCVLNPSNATFKEAVTPLLAEAYERDIRKHTKRADRG